MLWQVECSILLAVNEPKVGLPTKVITAPITVIRLSAAIPDMLQELALQVLVFVKA